jgi:hypothetical protein
LNRLRATAWRRRCSSVIVDGIVISARRGARAVAAAARRGRSGGGSAGAVTARRRCGASVKRLPHRASPASRASGSRHATPSVAARTSLRPKMLCPHPDPTRLPGGTSEFLAWEASQVFKHEFLGGEAFAMAGAADGHAIVEGNVYGALRQHLRGTPCHTFGCRSTAPPARPRLSPAWRRSCRRWPWGAKCRHRAEARHLDIATALRRHGAGPVFVDHAGAATLVRCSSITPASAASQCRTGAGSGCGAKARPMLP